MSAPTTTARRASRAGVSAEELVDEARRWWQTDIIDVRPGEIALRGYPIEELIGNVGFVDTIWLMLRGELPSRAQAALLRGRPRGVRRPRAAGPVDRDRPDGDDVRRAGQRRDGVGDQRARRHPRRPGPAVHGAVPRDRRRARAGAGTSTTRSGSSCSASAMRASATSPDSATGSIRSTRARPRLLSLVDAAAADGIGGRPLRGDRARRRGTPSAPGSPSPSR